MKFGYIRSKSFDIMHFQMYKVYLDRVEKVKIRVNPSEAPSPFAISDPTCPLPSEELAPLKAQHEAERQVHDDLQAAKLKLQELKQKLEVMEARHDVEAAADLRFDAIPGVLGRIRKLEAECRSRSDCLVIAIANSFAVTT